MIIIGEKINASIPKTQEAILQKDAGFLIELAQRQERSGAKFIDVNVGTGKETASQEQETMKWLIGLLKDKLDTKLCIDSADPKVIQAGLEAAGEKAGFINSVKGVQEKIDQVFALVSKYDVPVIALAMDEEGIPKEVSKRVSVCRKIIEGAKKHNVSLDKIYFDPLVMPISTDNLSGFTTLKTLETIKKEFPECKTCLAVSNVSFGLPKRSLINRTMLSMALYLGVDALLVNPLDQALTSAIKACEVILGKDRHCRKYTRAFRKDELK